MAKKKVNAFENSNILNKHLLKNKLYISFSIVFNKNNRFINKTSTHNVKRNIRENIDKNKNKFKLSVLFSSSNVNSIYSTSNEYICDKENVAVKYAKSQHTNNAIMNLNTILTANKLVL